eukprot:8830294-Alexandrium_andersonii.AAC.1
MVLRPRAVCTDFVRSELLQCGVDGNGTLSPDSHADAWAASLNHASNTLIGLVALQPCSPRNFGTILSAPERAIRDYWMLRGFHDAPLVFVDVADCVFFTRPRRVPSHAFRKYASSFFRLGQYVLGDLVAPESE